MALQRAGYNTDKVYTGQAVFDFLGKHAVDLILLDFMLPDLNGLEVIRRLHDIPDFSRIPVILLTGRIDILWQADRFKTDTVDLIGKPFTLNTLIRAVEKALNLVDSP
jgi:CheY-like chemotaxis protein